MKNPLRKRLPRELKGELGKYLVVFILMVASIGFVSGFLVADNSMLIAYNEGFEKYNIEDGNFRTAEQVHKTQREEIEALGVKLYDNYYVEEPLDNGSTMRFFKNRQQVDKVCLMKGELPEMCIRDSHKCTHVLIITDGGIMKLGLTRRLEKALKEAGIPYTIYDKTVANPTTVNVR